MVPVMNRGAIVESRTRRILMKMTADIVEELERKDHPLRVKNNLRLNARFHTTFSSWIAKKTKVKKKERAQEQTMKQWKFGTSE